MQALILVGKKLEAINQFIEQFYKEKNISHFDIITLDSDIAIKDIRTLQQNIVLKPSQGNFRLAVIKVKEKITTEAQSALLKTLEEPPEHTIIMLVVPTAEILLPTILSRGKIIRLKEDEDTQTGSDEYTLILETLHTSDIGNKLLLAQNAGKSREEASAWLEQLILAARSELIKRNDQKLAKKIRQFQKTHTILSTTNVNPRFALENLLLQL